MRVAINARFLIPNKMEGFGRITYEVTRRLVKDHPDDIFYLLFDRPHHGKFNFGSNAIPIVVGPPARHPLLWYTWFEWSVPRALASIKPDVFFSPDGYTTLSSTVKTLLMVHDISFIHYPEFTPFLVRQYYRYFTPRFLARADRLITLTHHARQDIGEYYDVPTNRFALTTVAAHGNFSPVSAGVREEIQAKYSEGEPYFLYVGAIHPRKNVGRLIQAFDQFKTATGLPHKLLIAGRFLRRTRSVKAAYAAASFKRDILFLGYLDQDLHVVTASAHALTYVSIYEGFGMPIVEAMNCHVPSITANVSSMPEVAGPTAILVDPFSIPEIAAALELMVTDQANYDRRRTACAERKHLFSWEKTADTVYEQLLELHLSD